MLNGGRLYYPKRQNSLFWSLERSHRPYAVRFVPEYGADHGSERNHEEVLAAETMQEKHEESHVEYGGEHRVEEVPWKKQPAQLYVMSQYSNLNLTDQNIMSADLLLLNQAQLPKLLKMMEGDAWTAKMQRPLNFPDAHGLPVLEEEPVDFPCLSSERVLELGFAFLVQSDGRLSLHSAW